MRTSLQGPSQSQTQLRRSLWSKPTQPRSAFSSERLKTIWAEVPLPWRRGQKRVGPQCPWPRAPQAGSAPRTKPSLTLFNSVDCSPPRSSVYGITQARIPEWVAISFSRRSSRPRYQTWGLLHCRQILDHLSHQEAQVLGKKPWHPLVTRTASNIQEYPARSCGQKAPASLNHHLCRAFKTRYSRPPDFLGPSTGWHKPWALCMYPPWKQSCRGDWEISGYATP